jgi:membrane protein involved in colicin uptake
VLKGPSTAILLSIFLHILLLAALIYSSINAPKKIQQTEQKFTTIKSFLYKKPKKIIDKTLPRLNKAEHKAVMTAEPIKPASAPTKTQKPFVKDVQIAIKKPAIKPKQPIRKTAQMQQSHIAAKAKKTAIKAAKKASFSSYDSLSRLRSSVEKKQREQAFNEIIQQRSVSIMDAAQLPVPHTTVPLTSEQKYQKNTSTSHVGTITKNDNGTCTIHRQQILGSPVEATTSTFACGESKFDKNFREHMQKVQAKLPIKK